MVTTRLVRRAPIVGLRPGRCASFGNPGTPSARKRLRQRETFFGVIAMLAAISLSDRPDAANNTIRARPATPTGGDRGVFSPWPIGQGERKSTRLHPSHPNHPYSSFC